MWRRFSFFTTESRELPRHISHGEWACGDIGRGKGGDVMIFGMRDGRVQVFDASFQLLAEFRAHVHSATFVRYLDQVVTLH